MNDKDESVKSDAETMCQWFLACSNPATTTAKHPFLGDVPICERCKNLAG